MSVCATPNRCVRFKLPPEEQEEKSSEMEKAAEVEEEGDDKQQLQGQSLKTAREETHADANTSRRALSSLHKVGLTVLKSFKKALMSNGNGSTKKVHEGHAAEYPNGVEKQNGKKEDDRNNEDKKKSSANKHDYFIPVFVRNNDGVLYSRKELLGHGSYGACYRFVKEDTEQNVAIKIISKESLFAKRHLDKVHQEMSIHRGLSHPFVVRLLCSFEDTSNFYLAMELCNRHSLSQLIRRRKMITEPEARYFFRQLCSGLCYLHSRKIIHRDLKLGNLLLNDEMQLKIGDFGLSALVDHAPRLTFCGTATYMAPEIITKTAHSYSADIWSSGCILYALLYGRSPFHSESTKKTYQLIKLHAYSIPHSPRHSPESSRLIRKLLSTHPNRRPTADEILLDEFFNVGFTPASLPPSCLTMAPHFETAASGVTHSDTDTSLSASTTAPPTPLFTARSPTAHATRLLPADSSLQPHSLVSTPNPHIKNAINMLESMLAQLRALILSKPPELTEKEMESDLMQSPDFRPIYWINRWKYNELNGDFSYTLCDNSVGMVFGGDSSTLVLDAAAEQLTVIDAAGRETFIGRNEIADQQLMDKFEQLLMNKEFMMQHLAMVEPIERHAGDELARLPWVVRIQPRQSMLMQLSTGTVQLNLTVNHHKLLFCPLMSSVTIFSQCWQSFCYRFDDLKKRGCSKSCMTMLAYAEVRLSFLLNEMKTDYHK